MLTDYWECFDENTLLTLILNKTITKKDVYDINRLTTLYKRYYIKTFFGKIVDINEKIFEDFEIYTRMGNVYITLPIFFKHEIILYLPKESEIYDLINTFTFTLPKDEFILIIFEDSYGEVEPLYFIFTKGLGLLVYRDNDTTIVDVQPIKLAYHLRNFFEANIINRLPTKIKDTKDFEKQGLERCLLLKDIESTIDLLEYLMFGTNKGIIKVKPKRLYK